MEQHCIVKDCKNTAQDMVFYNGICSQCYAYLHHGVGNGQAYRNMVKHLLHSVFKYLKRVDEEFTEELPVEPVAVETTETLPLPPKAKAGTKFSEVLPSGEVRPIV